MNSNTEDLPPPIIHLVSKEMAIPTAEPLDGINVFPNEEDVINLQASIKGPEGTPYDGSLFCVKLLFDRTFCLTIQGLFSD